MHRIRFYLTRRSVTQALDGYTHPAMYRGSRKHVLLPQHPAWSALRSWWLTHAKGANTPNRDVALSRDVENRAGLVLIEGKANCPELSESGKRWEDTASPASQDNHARVAAAIDEARRVLEKTDPNISIPISASFNER